jgi:hypothetical protein
LAQKKIAKVWRSTVSHNEFIDSNPDSISVFEVDESLFSRWTEQFDMPALLDRGGMRVIWVVF